MTLDHLPVDGGGRRIALRPPPFFPIHGLHLKADRKRFADFRLVKVNPTEPHAANVLRIGDALIMPAGFPLTRRRLPDAGLAVTAVDVSELRKAKVRGLLQLGVPDGVTGHTGAPR